MIKYLFTKKNHCWTVNGIMTIYNSTTKEVQFEIPLDTSFKKMEKLCWDILYDTGWEYDLCHMAVIIYDPPLSYLSENISTIEKFEITCTSKAVFNLFD